MGGSAAAPPDPNPDRAPNPARPGAVALAAAPRPSTPSATTSVSTRVTYVPQLGHFTGANFSTQTGEGTEPDHWDASQARPRSSRVAAL